MMQPIPEWVSADTRVILDRLNQLEPPTAGAFLRWRVGPITLQASASTDHPTVRAGKANDMADLVLTADQQARLQASGVDADGNPVDLTGAISYACDNTAVLTLTDNGDGTALVVTTGPTGSALVTATGTTSGGDVIGSLAVDVVSGEVASIDITAAVEDQGTP
jgi:hypothetical protein